LKRLVAALLLGLLTAGQAIAQASTAIESGEIARTTFGIPPDDVDDLWLPVQLPHNWHRDPPPGRHHAWYRFRIDVDYRHERGYSLYLTRLPVRDLTVYVNRHPIWRKTDRFAVGSSLTAVLISIPAELLRPGENMIHVHVRGSPRWFHGLPRVHVGDTRTLSKRASVLSLLQGQMIHIVAAAFGVVGMLSLWLWLRTGREPVLFWYGLAGVMLLASSVAWYLTLWRDDLGPWRAGLIFLRFVGYLMPLLILHLRLAHLRLPWLEGAVWLVFAAAVGTIVYGGSWQAGAWTIAGVAFAVLPAFFAIPLLRSPELRAKPGVVLLLVADLAAALIGLHDWAVRFGWMDFDRPYLIYYVPVFVMLAASVPILDRLLAGVDATRRMNRELEQRVLAKTREINASHERLREIERERTLADERRRIMADMHDGLGARLVGLLSLEQSGRARPGELGEGIAAALDELRLAVDSVQPVEGDVGVVLGNVRHRMRSVFERSGVRLLWKVSALPPVPGLTPERILAIQRIFLEVFSNTLKHSGASTVAVFSARVPGAVQIVIEDDGRGFDPAAVRRGNGLSNLRLRASQAGGTLEIESAAGKGMRVILSLPCDGELQIGLPETGQKEPGSPLQGIPDRARGP
jgi:signal transduction histidine kinase